MAFGAISPANDSMYDSPGGSPLRSRGDPEGLWSWSVAKRRTMTLCVHAALAGMFTLHAVFEYGLMPN